MKVEDIIVKSLHENFAEFTECKASAVIKALGDAGFILVLKTDFHDHYIAEHLKGTTCSVDVSELTGSNGDRIYGKLRPYDYVGSDGNTLLYDLESSNFKMQRHAGNSGDYVLVPKDPTKEMVEAGVFSVLSKGGVFSVYKAMIEAAEVK